MVILGIDPGIGKVGWGVIKDEFGKQKTIDYGCFETSSKINLEDRLTKIYDFITQLIEKFNPEVLAIEQLYFAANSKTALTVGQARGVILLAASKSNLLTASYTPLQVKQALTGYGRADKNQIQSMVGSILHLSKKVTQDDAADALAIAITHAFSYKIRKVSQYKLK
ncbi:crossover junction endodeoxyribonuclease RuvC [Candidatus Daviesbacteria bacterium RIFCSPHIGHO2_02_FULL_39_12]|uniref:Crossover junction endodeoxyribonuclease RuvC n=1 Tax=Candidatus Daviesbacteria bacterium RIFCSPHIGHO2_02_FULL_39_12 TaxID=1797770 RepID=A0A1F5JBI3_9BACT|nr:MAG: crossover junction endodeoxyribonuclease RuvC [Candidatus Daviesbacteria bacterium RIFCSPHIGHO2_02_FULL_39_12]